MITAICNFRAIVSAKKRERQKPYWKNFNGNNQEKNFDSTGVVFRFLPRLGNNENTCCKRKLGEQPLNLECLRISLNQHNSIKCHYGKQSRKLTDIQ